MGYRYRENDRYYGRGPPSRDEDDYYERRGPPPSFAGRDRRNDERRFMREIATKALFLSSKKFYLDIVEGSVGKLLKLSEVSQSGQKSKMLMDLEMAVEFHDKISDFCDFLCTVDKNSDRERGGFRSEPIKNDTMVRDQRRYYLDLMENHRGMFLKVTMRSPTTERIQLVFPASGLPEVRDALTELLSEHGSNKRQKISEEEDRRSPRVQNDEANFDEDYHCDVSLEVMPEDEVLDLEKNGASEIQLPEFDQNKLDCRDRSFQFEVKTNETGTYLSITESSSKFRSVINVPQKCWQEFVSGIEEKLNELRSAQARSESAENFESLSDGIQ